MVHESTGGGLGAVKWAGLMLVCILKDRMSEMGEFSVWLWIVGGLAVSVFVAAELSNVPSTGCVTLRHFGFMHKVQERFQMIL